MKDEKGKVETTAEWEKMFWMFSLADIINKPAEKKMSSSERKLSQPDTFVCKYVKNAKQQLLISFAYLVFQKSINNQIDLPW